MRLILVLLVLGLAAPAAAQTDPNQIRLEGRLEMQRRADRERAAAIQRKAIAADARARTAAALRDLAAGRQGDLPPYAGPLAPAPLDGALAQAAETMDQRRAAALAAGNARILAIKPASRQP